MEITTCDIVDMLKVHLLSEKAAVKYYSRLAELAADTAADREISGIKRQKKLHYDILQELYADITGREYEAETQMPLPNSLHEGLKEAICRELDTAKDYAELACCLNCMRHKEKILEILNDKKCHAKILYKLYNSKSGI